MPEHPEAAARLAAFVRAHEYVELKARGNAHRIEQLGDAPSVQLGENPTAEQKAELEAVWKHYTHRMEEVQKHVDRQAAAEQARMEAWLALQEVAPELAAKYKAELFPPPEEVPALDAGGDAEADPSSAP